MEDLVVSTNDLQQWLSQRLPSYMIPSVFVPLSSFPLNASGKIDRKALPSPDRAAPNAAQSLAPRSETEEILAHVWCEVLGLSEVGVRDDFFMMGGNSILATQTIGKVNQTLGTVLNVPTIFSAPTIEALAAAVLQNQQADNGKSRIISLRTGKDISRSILLARGQLSINWCNSCAAMAPFSPWIFRFRPNGGLTPMARIN